MILFIFIYFARLDVRLIGLRLSALFTFQKKKRKHVNLEPPKQLSVSVGGDIKTVIK